MQEFVPTYFNISNITMDMTLFYHSPLEHVSVLFGASSSVQLAARSAYDISDQGSLAPGQVMTS